LIQFIADKQEQWRYGHKSKDTEAGITVLHQSHIAYL
jgi:hypothetical protein